MDGDSQHSPKEADPAASAESVFGPFRDDHRRVLMQLDVLEAAIDAGVRLAPPAESALQATVTLMREQFATHVAAEQGALYPALIEAFPESAPSMKPLEEEHREMRSMLARLAELLSQPPAADRDEQVVVQARDFVDLLRIHIRKEEHAVFNVAARVLTAPELTKLANRVAEHRGTTDPESGPAAGKGSRS